MTRRRPAPSPTAENLALVAHVQAALGLPQKAAQARRIAIVLGREEAAITRGPHR